MRKILAGAALLAVPFAGVVATDAAAYCDPKYKPLCTNDCQMRPPTIDPKDPLGDIVRACPE
ncbi:MAG TPA: hypothetical protein VNQ77_12215 [Frankiaceae bacterium]|nr:hypothetical protein [Frankiaceae bacterium]